MHCHIHCNLSLSKKCIVTYCNLSLSNKCIVTCNLNFSNKRHIHCNLSLSNKCIVTSTVIFPYPRNALSHTMQSFLIQQMHCHKQCNLNFSNKRHIHCNLSLSNKCIVTSMQSFLIQQMHCISSVIFPYPTNTLSHRL